MSQKFCIAAQAVALPLKEAVQAHLEELGYEVVDLVPAEEQPTISFTGVAQYVAKAVQAGEYVKGFVFCGTGMGVSMVANKYHGVRAALVESLFTAKMSRIVNNANVLCLGQWVHTPQVANAIVDEFVGHEFLEDETEPTSTRRTRLEGGIALLDEIGE
ncbi:MAG: RpiB/LacA/LacB family sugar-phosphate isomerase [Lachnospiraceae bacterium]|nr:RpiB/LacA/LacB family sugar-phosphate isomerase [Lachnospiraceae bacterium]